MRRAPAFLIAAVTLVAATAALTLVTVPVMRYYLAAHDPCIDVRTVCDSPSIVGFGFAAWVAVAGGALIARVVYQRLRRGDDAAASRA